MIELQSAPGSVSRRRFLRLAALSTALAAVPVLGACQASTPPSAGAKPTAESKPAAAAPPATTKPPAPPPTQAAAPAPTQAPTQAAAPAPATKAPAAASAATKPIRVASSGGLNFTSIPVFYAADKGLFEKQGLKPSVLEVKADTTAVQGLLGNEYELLFTSAGTGILAMGGGAKIKLVSSVSPRLEYFFVAQKSIPDLKAMEGKTLGVSAPGAVSYLAPRILLRRAGVDVEKINYTSAGNDADRLKALGAGSIDGAVLNTVNTVAGLRTNPNIHVLADVGAQIADEFLLTAMIVRQETVDSDPATVQASVEALIEACRVLQKDRADAIAYAKSTDKLPGDSVEEAYDLLMKAPTPFFGVDGGLNREAFVATTRLLKDSGDLKVDVTWEQAATTQFIEKAIAKLGPYR